MFSPTTHSVHHLTTQGILTVFVPYMCPRPNTQHCSYVLVHLQWPLCLGHTETTWSTREIWSMAGRAGIWCPFKVVVANDGGGNPVVSNVGLDP
jgi:hypothetical protein